MRKEVAASLKEVDSTTGKRRIRTRGDGIELTLMASDGRRINVQVGSGVYRISEVAKGLESSGGTKESSKLMRPLPNNVTLVQTRSVAPNLHEQWEMALHAPGLRSVPVLPFGPDQLERLSAALEGNALFEALRQAKIRLVR